MNYTLVTPQGRIYTFYIEATALCYQQAYGGVVFSQQILKDEYVEA
jgi:hypothetical protein